jgi:hypothetical protein
MFPIIIADPQQLSRIKELQVFVKNGKGDWRREKTAAATDKEFVFEAPGDGEYAFALVTIDTNGRSSPAATPDMTPDFIVVVDTKAPEVTVRRHRNPDGKSYLRCVIDDANPDLASLKLTYRVGDGTWKPLALVAGNKDLFAMPANDARATVLRVSVKDRAGNETTRELSLQTVLAENAPPVVRGQAPDGIEGVPETPRPAAPGRK